MDNRFKRQISFIVEADKLKTITRQNYLCDGSRKENDAEHSWHLALMGLLLSEHANEAVDILRVVSMVVLHDLVEIDAGDTYAYDLEAGIGKKEREEQAAERLFHILPEDQAEKCLCLWREFEDGTTPEARFAASLDRLQPLLLNDSSNGISWKEHAVKKEQVLQRNQITKQSSDAFWDCVKEIVLKNAVNGNLIEESVPQADLAVHPEVWE